MKNIDAITTTVGSMSMLAIAGPKAAALAALMAECEAMLRRSAGDAIALTVEVSRGLPTLSVDKAQLARRFGAALLEALEAGQISAAVLDVTAPEPLPADHPLWAHPRVILTPHIACQTRAVDGARHVIAAISADLAGQPVPGQIDRSRGY